MEPAPAGETLLGVAEEAPPDGVRYGTTPRQSRRACMRVLLRKHLVLGWRRRRFLSVIGRVATIVFVPLIIWSQQGPDSQGTTRPLIVQSLLPLFGVILLLLVFTQFVIEVVTDKELKMRYVQQIAGVSTFAYWLSYFLYYVCLTLLCAALYLFCVMEAAPFYKYSSGLLMLLTLMAAFLQTFFLAMLVSTVFSRARMAAVVCGVLGSLVVVFSQALLPQMRTTSTTTYFIVNLIPFVAPLNLLKAIGLLEAKCPGFNACPGGQHPPGFTWSSWSTPISGVDSQNQEQLQPPAGEQLELMLLACAVYGLFAAWFDQVYQGEFGAALPWNFCFRPAYVCPRRGPVAEQSEDSPALKLDRLVKVFGEHRAVDEMSLEVRRGEIFALLGHNGAGKTTAINCITGMLPITSGEARVCGADVATELQEARRHLSVCPQDNPLYLEYSVDEHLAFFAALRGVPAARAAREIDDALGALGLTEKRSARVQTLSGGQKRRLWVATSILGMTPLVFLDEPTSGMDPANRRKLWDLLVQMKNRGRTILFTTHYLDEADVLAQRKAVLDQGKVRVVGTSLDLKHQFGVGYHLRVVGQAPGDGGRPLQEAALEALVRQHVSSASQEAAPPRPGAAPAHGQGCFVLPYSASESFGQLFQDLEDRAAELGVADYVVEATSLEEVFMALGQGGGDAADAREAPAVSLQVQVPANFDPALPVTITHPQTGAPLEVMLPLGVQAGGTCTVTLPGVAEALSLASPGARRPVTWQESTLAVVSLRWRQVWQKKRSLCATFLVPLALMVLNARSTSNMLQQLASGDGPEGDVSTKQTAQGLAGASLGMTMTVSLAIALPYFATALVVDRVHRCTYAATSQGLPWSAYWVGTLLSNYLHFLALSLVVPLGLLVFGAPFYGEPAQLAKTLPAVLWAPVPMLLFAYAASRLFQSAEACSKFMPGISLLASVLPFLAVYIMTLISVFVQMGALACQMADPAQRRQCEQEKGLEFGQTMHMWANSLHTTMSFVDPFYCLPGTFAAIGLTIIPAEPVPGVPIRIDVQFPAIAGSTALLPVVGSLALSAALGLTLTWDAGRLSQGAAALQRRLWPGRSGEVPGAAVEQQLTESQPGAAPRAGWRHSAPPLDEESGVAEEERRVAGTSAAEHAVAYRGLVHTYNEGSRLEVRAVRGISLAVARGECFTLLGPNGAGKTTTLDVLTGAIRPPTAGEVSIDGHSVTGGAASRQRALQNLGNCPQVDPLWPSLTGRQHLLFYGRVKGLPAHLQAEQADALLRALGFSAFDANKPTQGYSGGMRRKLSLAIALVGSPPTLLLDEPSAAVDAAAKRHLWKVVKQRERTQTVILTTHSMEEAEALSDRLAIQVRGRLRCVGTPDHIKDTYGAGYQLELLVGGDPPAGGAPGDAVERFVAGLCPAARLLERHEGRYLFQLPVLKAVGARPGELSVARLFLHMQEARGAIALQDYSISRPSLEQVFLRFSREQEGEAQGEAEV